MSKKSLEDRVKTQVKKINNISNHLKPTEDLLDEMLLEIKEWRDVSGCNSPVILKRKITAQQKKTQQSVVELDEWRHVIPNCTTISQARRYIESVDTKYNDRTLYNIYNIDFPDKPAFVTLANESEFLFEKDSFIDNVKTKSIDDVIELDIYNFIGFYKYLYKNNIIDDNVDSETLQVIIDVRK